jgi:hypothetical protein
VYTMAIRIIGMAGSGVIRSIGGTSSRVIVWIRVACMVTS